MQAFAFSYSSSLGLAVSVAGLAGAGLAPRPEWVVPSRFNQGRRGGYQAMQQILALPERPTAVVVDNEQIHLRCFESTHEMLLEQLSQHSLF